MSSCCSGFHAGTRKVFGERRAEGDLKSYRRKGPNATTRLLRDGIVAAGGGQSLLDIGGGIGALSLELLARGLEHSTVVDASPAYQAVARRAAAGNDVERQMEFHEGDFVDHAPRLEAADVVALDRVVCCYPAYRPLLEASAAHCRRVFAYAYPHDRWYMRLGIAGANLMQRLMRQEFRAFVHPEPAMSAILAAHGFRRVSRRSTWEWCADIYTREAVT